MLTLYRRKNSSAWWMRLKLATGIDVRRSTGCEEREKAEEAAFQIAMGFVGKANPSKETPISLDTLIEQFKLWAVMRHTPGTLKREIISLKTFSKYTGGTLPSSIDPEDFIRWRLKSKVSESGINVDLRHLRAAFGVMVRLGWAGHNPFYGVKMLRAQKGGRTALSPDQLRAVLEAAKTHGQDIEIAVFLAAFAGLRSGEVAAACWDWVDLDAGVLTVKCDPRFTPKSKRSRMVPIHPELHTCLLDSRQSTGHLISTKIVPRKAWKHVQNTARVSCRFHSLRHTCATLWAASGVPPFLIQSWLGHSNITTTQGYVHTACEAYDPRVAFALPSQSTE